MKCEWRYFIVLNNDKEDIVEGEEGEYHIEGHYLPCNV